MRPLRSIGLLVGAAQVFACSSLIGADARFLVDVDSGDETRTPTTEEGGEGGPPPGRTTDEEAGLPADDDGSVVEADVAIPPAPGVAFDGSARNDDASAFEAGLDGTGRCVDPASTTVGFFVGDADSGTSQWFLRNANATGNPDMSFSFGSVGDIPLTGDWDGDGTVTPGVFRPANTPNNQTSMAEWLLRNENTPGPPDVVFFYGAEGDMPVVGDWDGDGTYTAGIVRPAGTAANQTSSNVWMLRNENAAGTPDITLSYGGAGDIPVAGDWDGNGTFTPGVFRPAGSPNNQTSSDQWFLLDENTTGVADITLSYGGAGDVPIVGDWDGNGTFTPGVFRPVGGANNQAASDEWLLRNENTTGEADESFFYGPAGAQPVVGKWSSCANVAGTPAADGGSDGASPVLSGSARPRVWLTADQGLTCDSGRVTRWTDQSGRGDDAVLAHGQLGPQCAPAPTPHSVNGTVLPYFSAPSNASAPNVVDETLDLDLQFLADASYTMFVVERRWGDDANGDLVNQAFLLGTSLPLDTELSNPVGCSAVPPDLVVAFGYVYYNGMPQLALDQSCDALLSSPVTRVPASPPAPLSVDTARFDIMTGHEVWIDGSLVAANASTIPASTAVGGAIGRAFVQTTTTGHDERFRGDIAEILVYDEALDDADRISVEAYLRGHWGL